MKNKVHCPIIHGTLVLDYKSNENLKVKSCCLRSDYSLYDSNHSNFQSLWEDGNITKLRYFNKNSNEWDQGCNNCFLTEKSGYESYRSGYIKKYGEKDDFSGPFRLDIMFTNSCNLACRTCSPTLSTFWQIHNKKNNIFTLDKKISKHKELCKILESANLSNLQEIVFSGGETLLGYEHWEVLEFILQLLGDQSKKLTVSFQTNGTQRIPDKFFSIIEKVSLVKLNLSIDGVGSRFEYLRWPASWHQVVDNIFQLKETLPVNVMFLVEETRSIYNLYYQNEVSNWVRDCFSSNRLGDLVDYSSHLANGIFSIDNITEEYYTSLPNKNFINHEWKENPESIKKMIYEIEKYDRIRNQDWKQVFPEVAEFYSRYL